MLAASHRSVAYRCLDLLAAQLAQEAPPTHGSSSSGGGKGRGRSRRSGASGLVQQLLRSSKRSHQLRALLLFVAAGCDAARAQQGTAAPQLPTASAVLAAEAALLLAAPAALMHSTVHKLLLRQPALDVAGLPLFTRVLSGRASGAVKGAAALLAERQWLLQLLWMAVRVSRAGRAAGCALHQQRPVMHASVRSRTPDSST